MTGQAAERATREAERLAALEKAEAERRAVEAEQRAKQAEADAERKAREAVEREAAERKRKTTRSKRNGSRKLERMGKNGEFAQVALFRQRRQRHDVAMREIYDAEKTSNHRRRKRR